MQVSPLLDSSLPAAVREEDGGVRAVPPAAAQPAPLQTLVSRLRRRAVLKSYQV